MEANTATKQIMETIEQALKALRYNGAIQGFALVLDRGSQGDSDVYEVMTCCPGHGVDMVDAEILATAQNEMGALAKVKLASQRPVSNPQSLLSVLQDLGFREGVPMPSERLSGEPTEDLSQGQWSDYVSGRPVRPDTLPCGHWEGHASEITGQCLRCAEDASDRVAGPYL